MVTNDEAVVEEGAFLDVPLRVLAVGLLSWFPYENGTVVQSSASFVMFAMTDITCSGLKFLILVPFIHGRSNYAALVL